MTTLIAEAREAAILSELPTSKPDPFASLRERLATRVKDNLTKQALKAKVRANGDKPLFGKELQKANADAKRLAALAAEDQWMTTATLITGQHQYCLGCGHDALCTTGLYEVQSHKHFNARRLKATQRPDMSLPIMKAVDPQDLVVHICAACALESDDPIAKLLEAAAHTAPFTTNQLSLF